MPKQKAAEAASPAVLLTFEPSDVPKYGDLKVYARLDLEETPIEDYFAMARGIAGTDPEFYDKLEHRYRAFARESLVSWNLTDRKGEPIPATEEGMLKVPRAKAKAIVEAFWYTTLNPPESDPNGHSVSA